ncbi:MAG: hypothetical protein M3N53_08245 [Actinomycetota bacterium]|nr:hypothetical protein [Actinomycetota bacterium]
MAHERVGGSLAADVDGDDQEDEVYLVLDEDAAAGCRSFLVAVTPAGTYATPTHESGVEYGLPVPRLNAAVPVDERPGAEIVVDLEQGAATQFLGLFTFLDGALVRVEARRAPELTGGLLPYGGSVGHVEATDCASGGDADVVVSVATPLRDRYEVRRRFYDVAGSALVALPELEERHQVAIDELESFPEYTAAPFGNCETA